MSNGEQTLIDFVIMKEGYGAELREPYEDVVATIAGRYGLQKERSFYATQFLGGEQKMQDVLKINVWSMGDDSMQQLGADEDYQSIVPFRDRIHNMRDLTLYAGSGDTVGGKPEGPTILVDLVVMRSGAGAEERDRYEERIAPIAARYGLRLFAAYPISQRMSGVGPEDALRLNFWSAPSPAAMQQLGQDSDYQAIVPDRNRIHNMDEVTLFFAEKAR